MGLGGWPIFWTLKDWNWLYNFIAPGLALATLVVAVRAGRDSASDRPAPPFSGTSRSVAC